MKRFLALDLGRRRVGLAVSDELGITAQGLEPLEIKGLDDLLEKLSVLIQRYRPSGLVLGLPKKLDGTDTDLTSFVLEARERLKLEYRLPVHLYDERLTSRLAQQAIHHAGHSLKKRKRDLDRIAAVIILTDFLKRYGQNQEENEGR